MTVDCLEAQTAGDGQYCAVARYFKSNYAIIPLLLNCFYSKSNGITAYLAFKISLRNDPVIFKTLAQ